MGEIALRQSRLITVSEGGQIADDGHTKFLRKAFASAHINVLLGSAFSINAVPTLGERESWFQAVDTLVRERPKDTVWGTARGLLRAEYFMAVMLPLLGAEPD